MSAMPNPLDAVLLSALLHEMKLRRDLSEELNEVRAQLGALAREFENVRAMAL